MSVILLRVDERLIHGQVVVGWGAALHADRVVVIDDALADSPWEQEIYCLGVPSEMEARFVSVDQAVAALPAWRRDQHRAVLLLRDVASLGRLSGALLGAEEEVNLGGVHHAEGRTESLPYLFLDAGERAQLSALAQSGIVISARDLPGSRRVPLAEVLARG